MTELSTLACSSCMAAVWRRTWAEIRLVRKEGQPCAAKVAYLASRCSTASRLRARPCWVGKRGSEGLPARSASQTAELRYPTARKGWSASPIPAAELERTSARLIPIYGKDNTGNIFTIAFLGI